MSGGRRITKSQGRAHKNARMRSTQIMHRTQRAIGFQQQIGMLSDRILIAIAAATVAAVVDLTDFAQQKCISRACRRLSMK